MNKQLTKIDEMIAWLEENAPEDACFMLMAMADIPAETPEHTETSDRKVEIKSFIEGTDESLMQMLVNKMVSIPLLQQVFSEALGQHGVKIEPELLLKWRDKNKYDLKFEPLVLPEGDLPVLDGEPEEYIRRIQEFCLWMNEKPSRNLSLLVLAQDALNSPKTTFAMGFAPDLSVLMARDMQENYGLRLVVEAALYAMETKAGFAEFMEWKDSLKK